MGHIYKCTYSMDVQIGWSLKIQNQKSMTRKCQNHSLHKRECLCKLSPVDMILSMLLMSSVIYVLCLSCFAPVHCCIVVTCWERTDHLVFVCDVQLCCFHFITFPCGILGQVWYLIVSIPDLCRLSYFYLCIHGKKETHHYDFALSSPFNAKMLLS